MHKKELSGRPAAKTGSREGAQPTAEEEDEGGSAAVPPPLVLPWRPLFNLMVSLFGSPAPRLEGGYRQAGLTGVAQGASGASQPATYGLQSLGFCKYQNSTPDAWMRNWNMPLLKQGSDLI
jgi:hypothetical protein